MTVPVSVVMAVHNGRRYLREQLDSVLSQLHGEDELIIVDDASTDDSVRLVRTLDSPVIKLFCNPCNIGVMRTFERGLRLARHPVIFLCDQDDVWLPGKREAYAAEFERDQRVSIVISDAEVIDAEGRLLSSSFMTTLRGGFDGSVLGTLWRNRYLGCAMALRRSLLPAVLPMPPRVPQHDMWIGALGRMFGRVVYLPTPYQRYRRHGTNASPLGSDPWRRVKWRAAMSAHLLGRALTAGLRLHVNTNT